MSGPLRVVALRTLADATGLRTELDQLNLHSPRPSPYATLAFLETSWGHDEHAAADREVLLLLAYDGDELVGFLPLRRSSERVLGRRRVRVELMVTHDTDRPGLVAKASDMSRCAERFFRYLLDEEPEWTLLELVQQGEDSALRDGPHAPRPHRDYVRKFEGATNATIPMAHGTLNGHFIAAFDKKFRNNLRRQARKLFSAGPIEFVSSMDPRSRDGLLDLYLEAEQRSWKTKGGAGIARHPTRLAFYRALMRPEQPAAVFVNLLLLRGVPVAGMVNTAFGDVLHAMEITYDDGCRELGAGNMILLMLLWQAYTLGFKSCNLRNNYGYYKKRWGAVLSPTENLQVMRAGSLHFWRAVGGNLRRLMRAATPVHAEFNDARRDADDGSAPAFRADPIVAAKTASVLRGLQDAGVHIERLTESDLLARLPFLRGAEATVAA